MKYQFPKIESINQVLPLIADRKEFVVAEREGFTVINYVLQMADTFPEVTCEAEAILRELRGIVFNNETGAVIARRYHKFFNVGEKAETQINEIDFSQPHVILEKLDGSMITPIPVNGKIRWGTKMGVTEVAKPVEAFVATRPQYEKFANYCMLMGVTPIFEWCSRQQTIVIDYPEDMLVLTAVRVNDTGQYAQMTTMRVYGELFGIPVVKAFEGTAESMQDLLDQVGPMVGCEGFVVRFDDGHMLKVKAEDYLRKHKAKDSLSLEKNVIELIVTEKVDDVKAFLDADDLRRVEDFEKAFWFYLTQTAQKVIDYRDHAATMGLDQTRAMYAVEFVQTLDTMWQSIMYSMFEKKSLPQVLEMLKNIVAKNCGTQAKVNGIRWMFGKANWISATSIDGSEE